MDELSHIGKIEKAFDVSISAHIGCELSYFDILELRGYIKELESYIDELKADNKQLATENERLIADLTAERERNRWIPVSEMPKEDGRYLCTWLEGNERIYGFFYITVGEFGWWSDHITHWRPIVPPEVTE